MKYKFIMLLLLMFLLTKLVAQLPDSFFGDSTKGLGKERYLRYKKGYTLDEIVKMYKNDVETFNSLFAIRRLARIYDQSSYMSLSEKPSDFNDSLCLKWYKLALDNGDSTSIFQIARYYDRHKNYVEAVKWYQKDRIYEPCKSLLLLHEYFLLGKGVKKDKNKALIFLREAEKCGEKDYHIAFCLTSAYESGGYGLKIDKKKYKLWLEKLYEIDKSNAERDFGKF